MEMVKEGRPWSFFAVIDDGLVAGWWVLVCTPSCS
jgi:hypothetical protein